MIRKLGKTARQAILDDFVARHGRFDPKAFVEEVRGSNLDHPAKAWFDWDDAHAAEEYRIQQARMFVQGLRIRVEIVDARDTQRMRIVSAPAFLSAVAGRHNGGGYDAMDLEDPAMRAELARQAITSLHTWERRYLGLCDLLGVDAAALADLRAALEAGLDQQPRVA